MNSTCSEARIVVRKGTAELRVEQLRIDRSTDVDQFTLLRVDPNDPKLAAPCLQQGVQIPLEPELELLNKGLRLPSVAEFRVAAEAVNCDLKASAKMLSAQVACSITFAIGQVWMTTKNDRALWQLLTMRYRQPTKGRFQCRREFVQRFQERDFLTVAVTVGTVDEAGTRAQNQDLTSSIDD
jgi:hypothetical protein